MMYQSCLFQTPLPLFNTRKMIFGSLFEDSYVFDLEPLWSFARIASNAIHYMVTWNDDMAFDDDCHIITTIDVAEGNTV